MPQSDEQVTPDLDDGTWHQPSEGPATIPPDDSTRIKPSEMESSEDEAVPARHTVPGGNSTPNNFATAVQRDSGDSDEVTPRPGGEPSDEWDLLPAPIIKQGNVVFGTYLLEERLGKGGMGEVWRVENLPLQKETALKLIDPRFAQDDKAWERFKREARVMAKINHPHAVAIYAFRRSHSMAFIEMEYVPGCSLEKYLKDRNSPEPLEWTARLLDQLCSVLQEAHGHVDKKSGKAKPIIHRDLKPSNLMLAEDTSGGQNLKVLDFGIAKMVHDEASPELTNPGDFVGTPHYMSPEQIRGGVGKDGGGEIDGRSDIYSVGVLLYQLLTGTLPFRGGSNMEVLVAHLHQSPRPMSEANPRAKIPPEVERLVMRCLEKDPDLRPSSARELATLFQKAVGKPRIREYKRPWWVILIPAVACLCLVAVVITAIVLRSGRTKPPEDSSHDQTSGSRKDGPATPVVWEPPGYKAIIPPDPDHEPIRLRRVDNNREFYQLSTGAYIPIEFEPESADITDPVDLVWPRVIVDKSNKARRFIRIRGGTYRRGDTRSGSPAPDFKRHPCTPHWVRVSGFYIQETEVTHGEIEDYLAPSAHPEAAKSLASWREYYDNLRALAKPIERARRFPAANISYLAARKFAEDSGGRLPTEAEWEYAAKSCQEDFCYPWGKGKNDKANKALDVNVRDTKLEAYKPRDVKTSADDQSEQHVFDLAGNVSEFCLDAYRPYNEIIPARNSIHEPLVDPCVRVDPGPGESKEYFIVRGGSFWRGLSSAMAFLRGGRAPDDPAEFVGFRVVIECPPSRELAR